MAYPHDPEAIRVSAGVFMGCTDNTEEHSEASKSGSKSKALRSSLNVVRTSTEQEPIIIQSE